VAISSPALIRSRHGSAGAGHELSDGQFFRAGGFRRDTARLNAHYGDEPGGKFYTHLSGRYAPFHTKVIAAIASEALHVLDGLLFHQSDITGGRHHTDGGQNSERVFALCSLLGFVFAPQISDLKRRRLYCFESKRREAVHLPIPRAADRGSHQRPSLIRAYWPEGSAGG
jgi:TnpA family transposase